MIRARVQTLVLIVLVAMLLIAVVRIYEVRKQQVPHNLDGHVIIDGSTTANPPAPPSMQ